MTDPISKDPMLCPNCETDTVGTFVNDDSFKYGVENPATLIAKDVRFFHCTECHLDFTGDDGEQKRTAAVISYLTARCRELESEVLRQHQRIASQQERITDLLCSYCGSPADAAGGIIHKSGCAGLETVELNRLQYDALSQGAKP